MTSTLGAYSLYISKNESINKKNPIFFGNCNIYITLHRIFFS